MKTQSLFQASAAALFAIALLFPLHGQSQSVDASTLCNDVTPANRAMAKSAGYDVDALCSGLAAQPQRAATPQSAAIPDRREMAQEKVADQIAPTAVVGVTATPPAKALKPFGYDLFAGSPNTFAPVTNVPVSPNYLLGPGDMLEVMFYGKTNSAFGLEINRDGTVNFPDLGPVGLAGLTFQEAKDMLQTRINAQMIGVQASISMGELRSMQIFVLGEAYKPGAYTVSSLSTITHALVVSGGVSDIASLRNIQLKRAGKTIASLDLYDLLMRGDTKNDIRLQPADVIFIPTVGDLVSVNGQVLRPAIYELKGSESVSDLIALAGGLGPKAYPNNASIERIEGGGFLTVLDLDLTKASDLQLLLKSGDGLSVSAIKDRMESTVSLAGHVYYPGNFSWKEDMRLSDLISGLQQFPPGLDLDYAILSRQDPVTGQLSALLVTPGAVIAEPGSDADLALKPRDQVMLFGQDKARDEQLKPLLVQLRSQRSFDNASKVVAINGPVKFPGEYPLIDGMNIKQLIKAAGGLTESAYMGSVEITREDLSDSTLAKTEIIRMVLSDQLRETAEIFTLQANDLVALKVRPEYRERKRVTLAGEVVFPGDYVISRGETLLQVINRAGGFTEYADINAAFFTRTQLRDNQVERLAELKQKMELDLAAKQLDGSSEDADARASALKKDALAKLSNAQAIGRLIIPLKAIMAQREDDIVLDDGDRLLVPQVSQDVTVIGEVQRPTSHLFRQDSRLRDYIELSGGLKDTGDKRAIYLVKSSGEVVIPRSRLFKFKSVAEQVEPGDTIVVPIDSDGPIKVMPLMAEVSRMIYELALGAAAINSFSSP
ncbi:SLBB domain-containing protein [SAR92 clade bacterium H455]|uniref:SLBB domain-containing protein n=1 Tax=SAR92 clade bacterium H455 TaxID=2974818 RepID=A0ABY5TQX2_9GAMM|nr:SLBB domain-containing protein [SAR92 clade bacterium H455]